MAQKLDHRSQCEQGHDGPPQQRHAERCNTNQSRRYDQRNAEEMATPIDTIKVILLELDYPRLQGSRTQQHYNDHLMKTVLEKQICTPSIAAFTGTAIHA